MTSSISTSFKRIYITFLLIIGIVCSMFMAFMLCADIIAVEVIKRIGIYFVIFIFFTGILFVLLIRNKIFKYIKITKSNKEAVENENIDDYTKEILTDIKSQSERLNFLIQSLIKMSRLENGIIIPSKDKTKIIDTISKVIQETYINSSEKDINISVECDKDIEAYFDIKWTAEALVNILENTIKYTNQGGYIKVSSTLEKVQLFRYFCLRRNLF